MIDYPSIITEDIATLLEAERRQSRAKLRDRIRILRLLKSGTARSLPVAADMVGLGIGQVRKLFDRYRQEGFEELCRWRYQGNHRKITRENELKLVEEASKRENGFTSQSEAQSYIFATFGVELTQPAISDIFSRNGIRCKTARPRNIFSSEEAQQEYKKNSHPK